MTNELRTHPVALVADHTPVRERQPISTQGLLEWAFAAECASLDLDCDRVALSWGTEYALQQRAGLVDPITGAPVPIDGGGRSHPADDAARVAEIVAHLPAAQTMALRVAELARTRRSEDWGQGLRLRCVPVAMRNTKHGPHAQTERVDPVTGAAPSPGLGWRSVVWCWVVFGVRAERTAARRRAYLRWLGVLRYLWGDFVAESFSRWIVTPDLPSARPWLKVRY